MQMIIDNVVYVDRLEAADIIHSTPGTMATWCSTGAKDFTTIKYNGRSWYILTELNAYKRKPLIKHR